MMRLVDGELPAAERIEVLKRLENQPHGWRDCALAFVEDQAWRQAMANPTGADGVSHQATATVAPASAADATVARSNPTGNHPASGKRTMTWVALAAAILMGFAAGNWSHRENDRDSSDGIAINSQQQPAGTPHDEDREADPQIVEQIARQVPNLQQATVLLDHDFWNHESSVPGNVREKLKALGAKVERKRGLMPVKTNDGREWIVPYEDFRVLPVNYVSI